jgi:hypothetical protein
MEIEVSEDCNLNTLSLFRFRFKPSVMDFSELFKSIKERLANPLFFSFIASWIFVNWEVSVALLWYDSKLYPKQGDLISFINNHTSNCKSVGVPILLAVGYTVAMPFIKNFVNALQTFGGNFYLWLSKESKISMSKFIVYKNLYEERGKLLEKVITDESKTVEQFQKLSVEFEKASADVIELRKAVVDLNRDKSILTSQVESEIRKYNETQTGLEILRKDMETLTTLSASLKNTAFIQGTWRFNWRNNLNGVSFEQRLQIIGDEIFSDNQVSKTLEYRITVFYRDSINRSILMVLESIPRPAEELYMDEHNLQSPKLVNSIEDARRIRKKSGLIVQDLRYNEHSLLNGVENGVTQVTYTKV